jgi:LacI family transcriptional regulator
MDLVAEHLAGLGHRKVLFLNGPDNIVTSSVRADAFAEAAAERGLTVSSVVQGGFSRQAGRDATDDVVAARRRGVTAVVAVNDYAAYGLMRGLQAIGIRVPEDMSIVGFGDLSISQISQPQMTTVRLPLYRLGAEAMQHAQRVLAGERPRRRRPLPVELVARDSTASRKSAPSKGRDGG